MANGKKGARGLACALAVIPLLTVLGFLFVPWRPEIASVEGEGVDGVLNYLLVVTGLILVVGHLVLCGFVWKYGSGDDEGYARPGRRTELAWSLGPMIVMSLLAEVGVLMFGGPVWQRLYIDKPENPFTVEVVGKQFEWFVRYPGRDGVFGKTDPKLVHDQRNPVGLDEKDPAAKDDVVVRGTLRAPEERDIDLRLRAQDVIHSYFVPQFRIKQDLIPGFPTRMRMRPKAKGVYEVACAELCGIGHSKMRGLVEVMDRKEFEDWMAGQKGWFED